MTWLRMTEVLARRGHIRLEFVVVRLDCLLCVACFRLPDMITIQSLVKQETL
jgi:hypothetical protein